MDEYPNTAEYGAAESDLHAAAWHGDLEPVRELVEAGNDVNWRDSIGESAIFGAAGWGHTEVVSYLIKEGARLDFQEIHSGYTVLHWAARSNVRTTQVLVEAGANVLAETNAGQLPVDIAHEYGKGEIVRYLKTVGPQIKSRRAKKK